MVLCHDLNQRRFCRHIFGRLCVCGRCHNARRAIKGLRPCIGNICRQFGKFGSSFFFLFNIIQLYSSILQHKYTYILGHISCSGSVPAQGVRRRGGSRPGNGNRCAGRLFHSGCRAGKSAGEGATQFLGCTDQLGASWSVCSKLYKYVECKWIFNQWDVYYQALRKVGLDHTILMQCVTVLLSYLPEAGQYSCIFVYLNLKMGFSSFEVAVFIAVIGILSIAAQLVLGFLMR